MWYLIYAASNGDRGSHPFNSPPRTGRYPPLICRFSYFQIIRLSFHILAFHSILIRKLKTSYTNRNGCSLHPDIDYSRRNRSIFYSDTVRYQAMHLLLNLAILWLALSVFVVATIWYGATVIKAYWPGWWQRTVVDVDPGVDISRR